MASVVLRAMRCLALSWSCLSCLGVPTAMQFIYFRSGDTPTHDKKAACLQCNEFIGCEWNTSHARPVNFWRSVLRVPTPSAALHGCVATALSLGISQCRRARPMANGRATQNLQVAADGVDRMKSCPQYAHRRSWGCGGGALELSNGTCNQIRPANCQTQCFLVRSTTCYKRSTGLWLVKEDIYYFVLAGDKPTANSQQAPIRYLLQYEQPS